ncbi:MAG: VOC family protein [Spirochaetales bacterium]|nr:VOC family protein [Spirochaetales bacterium]
MTITPYINLSGDAEDALEFYNKIFGGTTEIMRWSEMPPDPAMPLEEGWKNKIMHAALTINENLKIYLSDSFTQREAVHNSVVLHVVFDSEDTLRDAFAALSEGGTVNMPVESTFWGSVYGDVVDKYGTAWGLEYTLPE